LRNYLNDQPSDSPFRQACSTGQLNPDEEVSAFAQVLTGAVEPIVSALGMAALLAEQSRAEAEPEILVEEVLRLATPFRLAPRWSSEALTVSGTHIPAGARVLLLLHAANQDPRVHRRPARYEPGRKPRHLAFGTGSHYCLGAQLARFVLISTLAELRRRRFLPQSAVRNPLFGTSSWQEIRGQFSI
ncbi:MAG: cytochrome P450, partial [Angustibacter sp.]